jgi:LPS O-antigen subunit length determinant protein (WzzB/FepE family)
MRSRRKVLISIAVILGIMIVFFVALGQGSGDSEHSKLYTGITTTP